MYCQRKLFNKKPQIVVLLGAGAAIPWGGIASEDIKQSFMDIPNKRYRPINKLIFDLIEQFGIKDANFETFLAALEEILNYVLSVTTEGKNVSNTSFIPSIFRFKKSIIKLLRNKNEKEKREYCYEIFKDYTNKVITEINGYNSKALDEQYKKLNKNFLSFTKYFLNKNYSVKYYTTNYDNLIPQILSQNCKIYEGFHDSPSKKKRFKYDLWLFRKARLSHFNIHGSIFFHYNFSGGKYEMIYDDSKCYDLSDALYNDYGNPNENLIVSPIITGYNKTQRAANQPFNLGFNAFANDCNDCHALCIVGYSVSDPHINAILSSYISWNRARFIYVTQCENNFEIELSKLNDKITRMSKRESDDTWIHDNRKHIYKKGFEEFLQSKSNWKYLLS
jgi:hypothetical protein